MIIRDSRQGETRIVVSREWQPYYKIYPL